MELKTFVSSPDPSHDIWRPGRRPLEAIFKPSSVAIIGATEKPGSVGRTLFSNLIGEPFGGTVFPVNPKRKSVLGVRAYPAIAAVPESVDLAVIVSPAATVPGVIAECAAAGVRGAIIISAGFKELGKEGEELERRVLEAAAGRLRIVGPNCLGVMNPLIGLNSTFASRPANPGNVAFLSQSGALGTAILDWSVREHVGFSAFVSMGSMLDVGWADWIDYLGADPHTSSILLYMETIGNARAFLSAARQVALTKPIIVLKAGVTAAGTKAAASHTGSIAGSDQALDAAFDRCGVLRVKQISDLFDMAEVLAQQSKPAGPRLTIVANAGGPAVLTTDTYVLDGGAVAELAPDTVGKLNALLPPHWSHGNPVDVLGDADADRYAKTLEIVSGDANTDGVLVILTPQAMTEPTKTAEAVARVARTSKKPFLASWMGASSVEEGRQLLKKSGVPEFEYPDKAARMFHYLWAYTYNLRRLYKTPVPADGGIEHEAAAGAAHLIQAVRQDGRTVLSEFETKKLLALYGLPSVETEWAKDPEEAVRHAERMGFPVVLKLHSSSITHKTDVGGVRLDLKDAVSVRVAFTAIERSVKEKAGEGHFHGVTVQRMVTEEGVELILGSSVDPQLGPLILFGSGGKLVEMLGDHALALPPLNSTLARRMIERTRVHLILKGVRGSAGVDFAKLEQLIVRFSRLLVERREIREIEINPLLASPAGFVALDARAVLHNQSALDKGTLPRFAIRPYPAEYVSTWKSPKAELWLIRPIRP